MAGYYENSVVGSAYNSNLNLVGASVTVYDSGAVKNNPSTWTLSSIFSDQNLTVPLSNPISTDSQGQFSFYTASVADYVIKITMAGYLDNWLTVTTTATAGPQKTITSNYSITLSDNVLWIDATSGNITLTLPDATTVSGLRSFTLYRTDSSANTVTINTADATQINGSSTVTLDTQNEHIIITYDSNAGTWRY